MSDDPTRELPKESSFEARVLAELAAIRVEQGAIRTDIAALESRLATVESRLTTVESRLTTVESRLTTVESRLAMLEDKVDERLRETRPIWEAVQFAIKRLDLKFDTVLSDLYDVRTNSRLLDKRLMELESQ